jgi:alpha-tubulin suppressor-like RCC1 family protein
VWSFSFTTRCGLLAPFAVALLGSAACNETQLPTAPAAPEESPSFQISDGAHGGANPHFFFLPPVQPKRRFSGTFDAALSPTVRICALSGSTCSGSDISTFTLTTTPAIVVNTAAESYGVQWKTKGLNLSTTVNYRIQVFVGSVLLGFADVDVVSSSKELKSVPAGFVGLIKDNSLQINFRIEAGIVGQVTVSPSTATIEPGETQQFTATLTDLHGNPLSGPPITWASDNTGVATVDGNGLATGVAEGTATITATSQNVSGTATLTVEAAGLEFSSVSAGLYHNCGVTTSGAAYCWGYNGSGGLGNGTNTDSNVPVAVSGGHTFVSVSAGGSHSCGVTTSGAAYCWGDNRFGGLGNGTNTDSNVPVAVSGGLTFASVSAGNVHSCGVTTAGAAYCWGYNFYGLLGNGTNTDSNVPVAVSGGHTFASVSAGYLHSCGVTTSGAAYCWGWNGLGQLGNGTNTDSNVPVAVSGGLIFASVNAGHYWHSCGVTTSGAAYCWGYNGSGHLGNGTNTDSNVPVAVSGGHTFASVSAGYYHSCGVTTSGAAYCWGWNSFGQLGNGTNTDSNVPVAVSPP